MSDDALFLGAVSLPPIRRVRVVAAPPTLCDAADYSPGAYGHKCIHRKGHDKTEAHQCACNHYWYDPSVNVSKVRTVNGDLTL